MDTRQFADNQRNLGRLLTGAALILLDPATRRHFQSDLASGDRTP